VVHDPALLDALERLDPRTSSARVFRHLLGSTPPERPNIRGARWNPPGIAALYTSTTSATAQAEGDHLISVQPIAPRATRVIYEIQVSLASVLDLTDTGVLRTIGLTAAEISSDDWTPCQRVGGAAAWLEHDGLLVPSARARGGTNLVVLMANMSPEAEIQTLAWRPI
jgi:RES domain-containing protein